MRIGQAIRSGFDALNSGEEGITISMTQPINLNHARKAKAKAAAEAKAAENRITFGRTKAQRALDKAAKDKAARILDQNQRET